jgi:hypothetical protein
MPAPPCLPRREVTRPKMPPFELFQQPDPAARENASSSPIRQSSMDSEKIES